MAFQLLDTVVLSADIPEKRLRCGDVGAIVEVYAKDHYDVEFVTGDGQTLALITLPGSQLHPMGPSEILAVRQMNVA